MIRFLIVVGAIFALINPLSAESVPSATNCEQIRQAVATYGYTTVKRYALAHYSREAVRYGERCLMRKHGVGG
jgi:hypothetical protein